jgi:hypothetical protein
MADTTQSEHNYFQFDPSQLGKDWAPGTQQDRAPDMMMSNFGALNYGPRMSQDYTRTDLGFKFKVEKENPEIPSFLQEAEYDENPYVWGSTVKRTLDDQMFKMGMANNRGTIIAQPMFDVMDTNLVHGALTAGKNYPTEGWRSFGGKYDYAEQYRGVVR